MALTVSEIEISRLIFEHTGKKEEPVLVFIGGMHGNEPAGAEALERVFSDNQHGGFRGSVYALRGNLTALLARRRYIAFDFNRVWTAENLNLVRNSVAEELQNELLELKKFDEVLSDILQRHNDQKIIFLDLHTTSSESCSFLPFNDALMNREIAADFPVPLVLGIEEFLEGALMSYINDLGHAALAFEGGQHQDPAAIDQHESFVRLIMHFSHVSTMNEADFELHLNRIKPPAAVESGFYEILYRHEIAYGTRFTMVPGFRNFDRVTAGQKLAVQNGEEVLAPATGRIFMPLYQPAGEDGFFIGRPVSAFWLRMSAALRKMKLQRVLAALPGIEPHPVRARSYLANPRITRLLSREIFHLLGFRIKHLESGKLLLVQRD